MENGIIFRIKNEHRQLFVPEEMENNVIRLVHEKYGHLGIDKCSNQIKKHYWFPGMREKVNRFIRNCIKCIYYSPANRNNERNLYNIEKKAEPFDTLHIDHFGPLETVKSKHKHVLAIVDGFTKFVKLYAVNTSSKETICALKRYFSEYSRPRIIVSDRGTAITSGEFEEFCEEMNVQHILNAVASPQSNGQVERVNRVLNKIMAKVTDTIDHANWKGKLAEIEFALNNTVHCTTKQTPSQMLFGVEQRGGKVDELTEYLQEMYAKERKYLNEIREQAKENIQKAQSYNLKYHIKTHRPAVQFEKGDLVVIKNVDTTIGKNKKLIKKFKGPYVIRKRLDNDRYVVTDIENCQVTQKPYDSVIDSSRMRKWLEAEKNTEDLDKGNTLEHKQINDIIEQETEEEYIDDRSDEDTESI